MRRLCITIPDELAAQLDTLDQRRRALNVSSVCSAAIREEIRSMRMETRMRATIERLRKQRAEEPLRAGDEAAKDFIHDPACTVVVLEWSEQYTDCRRGRDYGADPADDRRKPTSAFDAISTDDNQFNDEGVGDCLHGVLDSACDGMEPFEKEEFLEDFVWRLAAEWRKIKPLVEDLDEDEPRAW